MKATLPNIKKLGFRPWRDRNGDSADNSENSEAAGLVPEPPKPPPDLNLFFMLSHLEEDGPVRLDGVKLAVSEVLGLELDEPKLGAFAGSLNALDFPVQLLVRQHPPVLATLREESHRGAARGPAAADPRRRRQPGAAADHAGKPGRHPGPAFLRRVRARPHGRAARAAGPGRPGRVSPGRGAVAPVLALGNPGRFAGGAGRE